MTSNKSGNVDPGKVRPPKAGTPASTRGGGIALGWLLLGLIVLGAAAAAGYKLSFEIRRQVRTVFQFRPAPAAVAEYVPPLDYLDETDHVRKHPGKIRYQFLVGRSHFGGQYDQPLGPLTSEYDEDLAGPHARGDSITAYYDPNEPQRNTLTPVAQPQWLAAVMLLLPLACLGLRLIWAGLGGRKDPTDVARGCYIRSYLVLSVLAAGAFYAGAALLPWQKACILGMGLIVPILPMASLLVGSLCADGARRRLAAEEALLLTPPAQAALEFKPAPPVLLEPRGSSPIKALAVAAWFALVGSVIYVGVTSAQRYYQALGELATAPGTVVSSSVQPVSHRLNNGSVTTYMPSVRFMYKVGGQEFVSNTYAWGMTEREDPNQAQQIADRYVPDSPVTVYYRPADPAAGVLDPRLPPARLVLLVAAQPPVVIALAMAIVIILRPLRRAASKRFLQEPAEVPWPVPAWGVLDEDQGRLIFQRRPNRLLAAGLSYVACSLAVLIAIALGGSARTMTEFTAAYATAAALCAGALGWLLSGRGRVQLLFDPAEHKLYVFGSELTFEQVQSWALSWTRRNNDGRVWALAPQVSLRLAGGGEISLHVFRSRQPLLDAQVARRTAEEFARITGSPVVAHRPPALAAVGP